LPYRQFRRIICWFNILVDKSEIPLFPLSHPLCDELCVSMVRNRPRCPFDYLLLYCRRFFTLLQRPAAFRTGIQGYFNGCINLFGGKGCALMFFVALLSASALQRSFSVFNCPSPHNLCEPVYKRLTLIRNVQGPVIFYGNSLPRLPPRN
jgi:hypothetical protein